MSAKQGICKWSQMVAKYIVHMHITAELKAYLLLVSEIKLLPTSDIFLYIPYSEKMTLHASVKLSTGRPSIFLITGYTCIEKTYPHQ